MSNSSQTGTVFFFNLCLVSVTLLSQWRQPCLSRNYFSTLECNKKTRWTSLLQLKLSFSIFWWFLANKLQCSKYLGLCWTDMTLSDSKRTNIILTRKTVQYSLIKCPISRIAFQNKITQGIWVVTCCLAETLQILSLRGERLTAKICHVCFKGEPTYHFASVTYVVEAIKQVPFRFETRVHVFLHKYSTDSDHPETNECRKEKRCISGELRSFITNVLLGCMAPLRTLDSLITDSP